MHCVTEPRAWTGAAKERAADASGGSGEPGKSIGNHGSCKPCYAGANSGDLERTCPLFRWNSARGYLDPDDSPNNASARFAPGFRPAPFVVR